MTFRVANIINTFNSESGGPPRTVSLIAEAGAGQWQADLYTTDYRESAADKLLVPEFPGAVNVMPSGAHTVLGGLAMLAGIARGHRSQLLGGAAPDVLHLHGLWSPFLAAFANTAMRNGIPYIVTPHGMLEPWSLSVRSARKSLALKLYQRRILGRAAAIHATSAMEAENIRRLNIGQAPVVVIPNGVAEPPVAAGDEAPPRAQKRVLLFLSRIHRKKGLDILLQAWNECRPVDWRLLIVGSGDEQYLERLRRYCAAHDIPDVEFQPHAEGEQRESMFRQAAAFILPTYSENFGNVVAEALIRGLPVVTTTGTPWSEIVAKQCGWYVRPTAGELRQAISQVSTTDPATLRQMGARGREYARSTLTLPIVRQALLTMYLTAINGRTRH